VDKKKPTPKKKADQSQTNTTKHKSHNKSRPDLIMASFLNSIEKEGRHSGVDLSGAAAVGAVMALSYAGLVSNKYVGHSLLVIASTAEARHLTLEKARGTLQ